MYIELFNELLFVVTLYEKPKKKYVFDITKMKYRNANSFIFQNAGLLVIILERNVTCFH